MRSFQNGKRESLLSNVSEWIGCVLRKIASANGLYGSSTLWLPHYMVRDRILNGFHTLPLCIKYVSWAEIRIREQKRVSILRSSDSRSHSRNPWVSSAGTRARPLITCYEQHVLERSRRSSSEVCQCIPRESTTKKEDSLGHTSQI